MAKKPTAERLREARESCAIAKRDYDALAEKLGTDEWDEGRDGPELDRLKRSFFDKQTLTDRLVDDLAIASRSVNDDDDEQPGAGGRPPVSVNVLSSGILGDNEKKVRRNFRLCATIADVVNGGQLKGLGAEMHTEGLKEARDLKLPDISGNLTLPGWLIGSDPEQRNLLATTTTAGGHTIQTDLGGLIPILDPRLHVEALGANVMRGLTGNLDFPRHDGDESATWEGEVDTSAESTSTFDKVTMSPKRLAAYTRFSRRVAIQSTLDIENFVRRRITFKSRKALDVAAINGSGLNDQPLGIMNTNGVNDITIGANGGPLDWALIVQFETETATDDADFGRLAYLTTPGVAGMLKTLKRDHAGNGFIWDGPNRGSGNVNGYKAMVSTQVPSNLSKGDGTNLHAMIFGNWEELMIGNWGGIDLLIDPYSHSKTNQVAILVNSFWDIALAHVESFCICNEIEVS